MQREERLEIGMSLATPQKLRKLQVSLYVKAKQEPNYRFYSLFDKVCREDVLDHAYELCRANGGASGVDGEGFKAIEEKGRGEWLEHLREEIRNGTYKPQAVRRVWIPKPGGTGQRPLGIPTIRDRVVQTAVKLVVEPIFEADFDESAYGYRPRRSALQAVEQVHQALLSGCTHVVDADLSKYFDSIPHSQLMKCVARRVSDGRVLGLIKAWLKAPVQERDKQGRVVYTGGKRAT